MIKKITFFIFILTFTFACGKKGDPEYKDPEKKAKIQSILINKA